MGWSLSIHMDSSSCYVVTLASISSFPPSIIKTCWWMHTFFFGGKLVGYGFNQFWNVDGSIHTFNRCDWQTSCGEMLVECIDSPSLINCSLVMTSKKGSLNCFQQSSFCFYPKLVVASKNQRVPFLHIMETSVANKPLWLVLNNK